MSVNKSKVLKRIIDIIIASIGIVIFTIPIFVLVIFASFSTKSFGIFIQKRVGQFEKPFYIFKIRSMIVNYEKNTFTTFDDKRITKFGRFLRRYKLDELPQLFNVMIGNMSIIGPRPDVIAMKSFLTEEEKSMYKFKPGLISLATLKYLNEEMVLSTKINPSEFYLKEIWPVKVQLNMEYVKNWNNITDLNIKVQFVKLLIKSLFR